MNRYKTECIVLKSINWREADKIFTLLSQDKGKISATAKGVRKINSRRRGGLDTLNHSVVEISEGNGGYKTITEVKPLNTFSTVKRDLDKSFCGFYVTELVHRFAEEDDTGSAQDIFDLLIKTLDYLDGEEGKIEQATRVFEVNLLRVLGYDLRYIASVSEGVAQALSALTGKVSKSYASADFDGAEELARGFIRETLGLRVKSLEIAR